MIRKIGVKNIWTNGHKLSNGLWEEIYERNIKLNKIPGSGSQLEIDGIKVSFLRPSRRVVYDSKRPEPLMVEIEDGEFKFHFAEEAGNGFFINNSSNVKFIPSPVLTKDNKMSENEASGIIICRECKRSLDSGINVYDTLSDGTIKLISKGNGFEIETFIN